MVVVSGSEESDVMVSEDVSGILSASVMVWLSVVSAVGSEALLLFFGVWLSGISVVVSITLLSASVWLSGVLVDDSVAAVLFAFSL